MTWTELFPFLAVAFAFRSLIGRRERLGLNLPRVQRDPRWFVVVWSFGMAAMAGLTGVFLILRGLIFLGAPQPGPAGPMMVGGCLCLLFGGLFAWVGVAVGRPVGVADRLARAAKAAWREFHAPTDLEAKPKVDPAARLLD